MNKHPSDPRRRKKKRRRYVDPIDMLARNPLLRLLAAALCLTLVIGASIGLTRIMQPVEDEVLTLEPEVMPTATPLPTPVPDPTITPTPAIYVPFGAQYGQGGEGYVFEATPAPTPVETGDAFAEGISVSTIVTAQPTAAPTAEGYTTLRKGAQGTAVEKMQRALIALGYLSGEPDGAFGANTQNAVTMFQAVNGLTADGIAGNMTLTLLYSGTALDASQAPEMDYLILVNRERTLDKNYVPTDLVKIENAIPADILKVKYAGTRANKTAVEALGTMLRAAIADGVGNWQVSSAYRGYADQQALVDQSVRTYLKNNPGWTKNQALSATYNTVAPAGTSEHMTGLAFDITVPGSIFKGTPQQKWLHKHCAEYGFVVRFTESKQKLTGFLAEDWHIRYVGVEVARMLTQNNWCLEEYYTHMGL